LKNGYFLIFYETIKEAKKQKDRQKALSKD
jgi:hypothetical protein